MGEEEWNTEKWSWNIKEGENWIVIQRLKLERFTSSNDSKALAMQIEVKVNICHIDQIVIILRCEESLSRENDLLKRINSIQSELEKAQ